MSHLSLTSLHHEMLCKVFPYTGEIGGSMAAEKIVSISFRVSAQFKALLEVAAAREHRSQTNMLESLLFAHCEAKGIVVDAPDDGALCSSEDRA
jgi:hypothetical protein